MSDPGDLGIFPACVGSGYCCLKTQCIPSVQIHGRLERCPELEWNGQRYVCNLILGEGGEFYRRELYAGVGCSSSLNTWRQDVKDRG